MMQSEHGVSCLANTHSLTAHTVKSNVFMETQQVQFHSKYEMGGEMSSLMLVTEARKPGGLPYTAK